MQIAIANSLAQAVPADVDLTAGQATAGVIALLMMAFSFGMGVTWASRIAQAGSALPAASRGILRCPPALSAVAVVLTALLAVLAMASSLSGESTEGTTGGAGVPAADEANPDDDAASDADDAQNSNEQNGDAKGIALPPAPTAQPTNQQNGMQSLILNVFLFDLILLVGFGFVIWLNHVRGRVRLPSDSTGDTGAASPNDPNAPAAHEDGTSRPPSGVSTHWPDLDQPASSADPTVESPSPYSVHPAASSRDDAQPGYPSAVSGSDAREADGDFDEPRNLWTELRYAAEVFLVALLPTMLLRMLVVTLYMNALNLEDVPQHPFLELMQERSGVTILIMIAFLAAIMAPVTEELLYRVVILGGMAQSGHVAAGMALSSILFCLAHGFPDCVALLPLALLLGYTYLRRRSYVTVMIVHFLFNAFNLMVAGIGLI